MGIPDVLLRAQKVVRGRFVNSDILFGNQV